MILLLLLSVLLSVVSAAVFDKRLARQVGAKNIGLQTISRVLVHTPSRLCRDCSSRGEARWELKSKREPSVLKDTGLPPRAVATRFMSRQPVESDLFRSQRKGTTLHSQQPPHENSPRENKRYNANL